MRPKNTALPELMRGSCYEPSLARKRFQRSRCTSLGLETLYQLPALDIRVGELRTSIVLFAYKAFTDMDRDDRLRATYQHSCLRFVMNEKMTNQSLRNRFKLPADKRETVSRTIRDAIAADRIKLANPDITSPRNRSYVPFWA